jgi:peptide-O-fucosyltransferase
MCLPSKQTILKDVKKAVKAIKAKGVYVATDNDPLQDELSKHLKSLKVKVVTQSGSDKSPQLDLAILGQADHFIGNCVSSFTAFAVRERDAAGRSSSFFAFDKSKQDTNYKDEL